MKDRPVPPFTGRLPIPSLLSLSSDSSSPPKKSHARKRSATHVPRPRNAFILFRCDFVRQQMVPREVEKDHRNLSRIAGIVWKEMSPEQRAPWVMMAQREKREHAERYPTYRYKPDPLLDEGVERVARGREKRRKEAREGVVGERTPPPHSSLTYTLPGRRSSSCPPPGSAPVVDPAPAIHDLSFELPRRPSSVMFFHSIQPESSVFHSSNEAWTWNQPATDASQWTWNQSQPLTYDHWSLPASVPAFVPYPYSPVEPQSQYAPRVRSLLFFPF